MHGVGLVSQERCLALPQEVLKQWEKSGLLKYLHFHWKSISLIEKMYQERGLRKGYTLKNMPKLIKYTFEKLDLISI